MRRMTKHRPPRWLRRLAVIGVLLTGTTAWAGSGTVVARARSVAASLQGFARVEPVALARLRVAQEGMVTGWKVLPGQAVDAEAVLGHLKGPAVEAMLARRRSALASARGERTAARKTLALEREKLSARLGTRENVYRAEAALAGARARFDTARSALRAAKDALILRAPATGTVLKVEVAAGERVEQGQTILTLQPADSLWLRAVFYGAEAQKVRVGMTGRFAPAAGGAAIPVTVRTVIGTAQSGGGRAVGMEATHPAPGWQSGEAGTVTLEGAKRTFLAVPTRALVLDGGRWWVLVHAPKGYRRQAVVPGPSYGTSTLIAQGLKAGDEVLVENAYLEFHRDFSRHYQLPD